MLQSYGSCAMHSNFSTIMHTKFEGVQAVDDNSKQAENAVNISIKGK